MLRPFSCHKRLYFLPTFSMFFNSSIVEYVHMYIRQKLLKANKKEKKNDGIKDTIER